VTRDVMGLGVRVDYRHGEGGKRVKEQSKLQSNSRLSNVGINLIKTYGQTIEQPEVVSSVRAQQNRQ